VLGLYKISQDVNNNYDTYSDAIVAAESHDEAQMIHPSGEKWDNEWWTKDETFSCWAKRLDQVKVELIGIAANHITKGVICASFHAG